jgi:hypothetical protein
MTLALIAAGSFAMTAQLTIEITSPTSIARVYDTGTASYGSSVTTELIGNVALTDDGTGNNEGCNPITNDVSGKIALSVRGTCNFSIKAFQAEQAGAIAAIMCNNLDETFNMFRGDSAQFVTIPHVMLTQTDCQAVIAALADGDVTVRIFYDNWGFDDVLWGDGADGGDFDADLGGFTTNGISDPAAVWVQSEENVTDGSCGSYKLQSPTGNNGVAMFDADNFLSGGSAFDCGTGAGAAASELISPVIDCSNFDAVALRFWQFNLTVDVDENVSALETTMEFSTDGGTTWSAPQLVNTGSQQGTGGNFYANGERVLFVIPEAIGAENFQFKLVYNRARLGFYMWMVDDVALIRPPDYDVRMEDAFYTPLSVATPVLHLPTDTFGFSANLNNAGTQDDAAVVTNVTITDANGTEWMNQTDSRTIPANSRDTVTFMSVRPEFPVGSYTINYTTGFDGVADELPDDNAISYSFEVTEDLFAKEDQPADEITTSYIETRSTNYFWGNFYTLSSEVTNAADRTFVGSEMACGTADGTWDDETFTLYLLKWSDTNDQYPSQAELNTDADSPIDHDLLEIVAFAVVDATDHMDNTLFSLNVSDGVWLDENLDPYTELVLDAGATYAIVAEFANNDQIGWSTAVNANLAGFPGILYNPTGGFDYFSGFNGSSPIVRMRVQNTTGSEDIQLNEVQANVFPTLATDVVNVELTFDEKTDTRIYVTDMTGRIQAFYNLGEISEYTLKQDVTSFSAGMYLVNIETSLGQKQVPITVIK